MAQEQTHQSLQGGFACRDNRMRQDHKRVWARGGKAPLYRLPTVCYTHSFPGLLREGVIGENEADALVKFYAEAETFNRGLDLADIMSQSGNEEALDGQVRRILLKARRIASPSGELYKSAHNVVSK